MKIQPDFSTLLYIHARDPHLSAVFFEPCEATQLLALTCWLLRFGLFEWATPWMLEEAHQVVLSAWYDEI